MFFHEFAVDPSCIGSLKELQLLASQFGLFHGRFITEFPENRWFVEVRNRLNSSPGSYIDVQRLTECLKALKDRNGVVSNGRRFQAGSWIDNALRENAIRPFHAVVSDKRPPNCDNSITLDDLHVEDSLWQVRTDGRIHRTTDEMWQCTSDLIRRSNELLFVDPHFDPTASRFTKPFHTILRNAHAGRRAFHRIEYHSKPLVKDRTSDASVSAAIQRFKSDCRTKTPASIPRGVKVSFWLWQQRDGGDELHARYILTECGGIAFDKGLDYGKRGETTDVRLLNRDLHASRWRDFQPGATTYDLVAGPIRVVGRGD